MLYRLRYKIEMLLAKTKNRQPATAELKLPNFFIIGANKAGTTSLHYYCRQHPEIFMSKSKEPMFFTAKGSLPTKNGTPDNNNQTLFYQYFTLQEYMGLFVSATEPVRGESSTSYLANPHSTMWIRKLVPDAKLAVILRNPIERAVSDFEYQMKRNKTESRTLMQAMTDALNGRIEVDNLDKVGSNIMRSPRRYLTLGNYGSQLSIVKSFFPDDQLFIADYEEYNKDTESLVNKVYKFLGVSNFSLPDVTRLNTSNKKSKPRLDRELESKLKAFFEEDINLLQTLVDFDVKKWLR